jgi:hypothetical protein
MKTSNLTNSSIFISEKQVTSIFRVEEYAKRETNAKPGLNQNISQLSTDYMVLYARR